MHTMVVLSALTLSATLSCANIEVVVDIALDDNVPTLYVLHNGKVQTQYPIAVPRTDATPRCLYARTVSGTIQKIDASAFWYPTQRMLTHDTRLKSAYPPDDPDNALAGRKLVIVWNDQCIPATVRIHATYNEESVHRRARASSGCFRMLITDWEDMAQKYM